MIFRLSEKGKATDLKSLRKTNCSDGTDITMDITMVDISKLTHSILQGIHVVRKGLVFSIVLFCQCFNV